MSTESPEYTEVGARLAGEYLFGGLIAFGVMVFSWLVSADCYFSSRIYNATTAMAVAWIFLYIAVAVTVNHFPHRTMLRENEWPLAMWYS